MTDPDPTQTATATATASSLDPTGRDVWRAARGPVLVAVALLLVGALGAVLAQRPGAGALDPAAADPAGSLAVAELLRDRDVDVDRRDGAAAARSPADAGPGTTVVLPFPDRLPQEALRAVARSGADVVAVAPGAESAETLLAGLEVRGRVPVEPRQPACPLPAARAAGDADLGGTRFRVASRVPGVSRCYAARGDATLVHVEPRAGRGALTVLGTGAPLQNASLDERGNAALALSTLGRQDRVLWLLPPVGLAATDDERSGVTEVLPDAVLLAALQLVVAAAVLALARGRRLGRVVPEPLPVVVRAAETTEGLGRLYRAAGARDRAAEALRAGARARLGPGLGVPADAGPDALVAAVAQRVGAPPPGVGTLLYGPPPADDAGLVRLASALDDLTTRALGGTRPLTPAGAAR